MTRGTSPDAPASLFCTLFLFRIFIYIFLSLFLSVILSFYIISSIKNYYNLFVFLNGEYITCLNLLVQLPWQQFVVATNNYIFDILLNLLVAIDIYLNTTLTNTPIH